MTPPPFFLGPKVEVENHGSVMLAGGLTCGGSEKKECLGVRRIKRTLGLDLGGGE